jgi:NADH/NAD ratio-sensing transcriptional regulator Rex
MSKKSNAIEVENNVNLEKSFELDAKIFSHKTLEDFSLEAFKRKEKFEDFLNKDQNKKLKIYAYGAAAKGISFLNFCDKYADKISGVFDKNKMKQGCFIPGLNIEILDPENIKDIKPDYIIILPWNLKDEIQEDLSYISNWGGKFVSFE